MKIVCISVAVCSLGANGVLGYLLHRSRTLEVRVVKVKAWRSCHKLSMQHLLYHRAKEHARREGRSLVVIGNPSGGFVNKHVRVYGCGDVCIDIKGCKPCGPDTRVLKMDAYVALKTLPADSAVVFESEVFEYVRNMHDVVRELGRITGQDFQRIYAVHTIGIDCWRYHTEGVAPAAPTKEQLARRRKDREKYARTGEGLAKRIIYRFPPRHPYAWTDLQAR